MHINVNDLQEYCNPACVLRFNFKYFHLQFLKKSLYNNYFLYENIVSAWEQN